MRQCPTREAEGRPLIAHQIGACQCLQRQREFYHKCRGCAYHGKAVDWLIEPEEGTTPRSVVEIPRNGVGRHTEEAAPANRLRFADANEPSQAM